MIIQVNTDRHIDGSEKFTAYITDLIKSGLGHLSDHITRIEVHLSDENGSKSSRNDKRCIIEARLEGRKPVSVKHDDDTVEKAVDGAIDKLKGMIDTIIGRQRDTQNHGAETITPKLTEEL